MPPVDSDAKIPCPTPQHLIAELDAFQAILALGEKEDTWEKLEKAVIRFAGVTRGGGYKHLPQYVEGVGRTGVGVNVAACMLSDRGRLSGVTTELLQTLAPRLGQAFAPLVTLYFDPLIRLLGRPNKVYLKRAEKCLQTIISHCQLPSILAELRRGLNDEAATCRRGCAIGFERTTREWEREVFGVKGVERLEDALRKMATDKDPEVRQISKRIWVRYNEVWPERVEDFSAPLTPTIKRYLDIRDAKNPSKSKAPSRPMPPPQAHRPIAATSSVASSSEQQSHKPQHQRVHALTTKTARPNPPATLTQAAEAGPSKRILSPAKKIEMPSMPALPASPPALTQAPPVLTKSISSASLPPEVFTLGRHGRSVSHNILTSRSLLESEEPFARQHNPLGKPSRPILPPSFSTTSLPSDPSGSAANFPARRMAPPARILRPQQLDVTEEAEPGDVDPQLLYATPGPNGVLRGATRPERGVGWPKRGLGKAERRVVTAPIPSLAKTPAARDPLLSRSVSDHIKETEIQPGDVPLPPSPSSTGKLSDSPELTKKVAIDSPLLPVLMRSQTDRREGREPEMIDTHQGFLDEAAADLRLAMDTPLPREEDVEVEVAAKDFGNGVAELDTAVLPASISATENAGEFPFPSTAPARDARKVETVSRLAPTIIEAETDHLPTKETGDSAHNPALGSLTSVAEATSIVEPARANVPIVTREAISNPRLPQTGLANKGQSSQAQTATRGIDANAPKHPVQRSSKPPAQLKTSTTLKTAATLPKVDLPPATRKPPIPKVGKAVSAEGRRPFKPTSAAPAPTANGSTKASDIRPSASTSDASVPVSTNAANNKMIAEATKTKSSASAASVSKPVSKPPIPKAVPVKTTVKTTAPVDTKAPIRPNQAKAQVTLPPVKTEKVKRKPPLPSFRPVSKAALISTETSAPAKGLAASTSSNASAAGHVRAGEHKEVVAKVKGMVAKVRPETIPLPSSPAERAKLPPADVPLPQSPTALSPCQAEPNTSDSPSLRPREFDSTATRFESKASTLPPASDYLDSESDDDALQGVTFKSRLAAEPRRNVVQLNGEQERDLIEFSAPSRPKVRATETPVKTGKVGTPFKVVDREVLGLRDANTPRKEIRSGI